MYKPIPHVQTYANTVQLYPIRTSSIRGSATPRYTSIWRDSVPYTLSKVKVLVVVFSPTSCLTATSPFLVLHSTALSEPLRFSATLRGLHRRNESSKREFKSSVKLYTQVLSNDRARTMLTVVNQSTLAGHPHLHLTTTCMFFS